MSELSGEDRAQPQPRGEGDDLAARLESMAQEADKAADKTFGEGYTYEVGRSEAFREAAQLARASTEGESARNFEEVVLDGDRFLVPAAVARALAPAHGEQEFDYEGEDGR